MRSAVPLPCLFDVVKSQKVAGQRPRQGTKSCRMGRNSIRPSIRFPYKGSDSSWRGQRASWRGLRSSWRFLRASQRGLRAYQRGLRACQEGWGGRMDRQTDVRTDGISPHSTGVCPLSGPLPCYLLRLCNLKEAGQGNR